MSTPDFGITDSAAKRISFLMGGEKPGARLRITVQGGGCSGFQYSMDFDDKDEEGDQVFTNGGAKVVIDAMSLEYLKGSVIDYVETLGAAAFEIKNPNATAKCGCGNSFSVM